MSANALLVDKLLLPPPPVAPPPPPIVAPPPPPPEVVIIGLDLSTVSVGFKFAPPRIAAKRSPPPPPPPVANLLLFLADGLAAGGAPAGGAGGTGAPDACNVRSKAPTDKIKPNNNLDIFFILFLFYKKRTNNFVYHKTEKYKK
jgi:hypothetical protein